MQEPEEYNVIHIGPESENPLDRALVREAKKGKLSGMAGYISMAVLFLLRFNSISTKGYVLRKLESERLQLVKEIERKEMEISNVRTLEFILNSEKVKRFSWTCWNFGNSSWDH